MVNELKPCPLCGSSAHFDDAGIEHDLKQYSIWSVWCDNEDECGCCTGDFDTKEEAAAAWNRRAERTCRVVSDSRRMSQTQVMTDKACSACGHLFGSEETRPVLPGLDETMILDAVDIPNYCPNCGARVVEETTL